MGKMKDQSYNLSCNSLVKRHLDNRGIESQLWEDRLENSELFGLHNELSMLTHKWYLDKNEEDISVFDGFSIGNAIAIYAYWDLESWARLLFIFEKLAQEGGSLNFHVASKNYLPERLLAFITRIKAEYDFDISLIEHNISGKSIELEPGWLLSCNRNHTDRNVKRRKLVNYLAAFTGHLSNAKACRIRCFVHAPSAGFNEYLEALYRGKREKHIRLFHDNHGVSGRMWLYDLPRGTLVQIPAWKYNEPTQDEIYQLRKYAKRVSEFLKQNSGLSDVLLPLGSEFFEKHIVAYFRDAVLCQARKYLYLKKLFLKNKINVTITTGEANPESYMFKYWMDRAGGTSFYLPHGIVNRYREDTNYYSLAHYFFQYSDSEMRSWRQIYGIEGKRFLKVGFGSINGNAKDYRMTTGKSVRILVLQDVFNHSLLSRINLFDYYEKLIKALSNIGVPQIVLRPHPFFEGEVVEKFMRSMGLLPNIVLEDPRKIGLLESLKSKDVIIGMYSTCLYEALISKVFYITYVPNYVMDTTRALSTFWFPELYPTPVDTPEAIVERMRTFLKQPQIEYDKFMHSIEEIGLYNSNKEEFWTQIFSIKNNTTLTKARYN